MAFENYRPISDIMLANTGKFPTAAGGLAQGFVAGQELANRRRAVGQRDRSLDQQQELLDRQKRAEEMVEHAAVLENARTPEEAQAYWRQNISPLLKGADYSLDGHRQFVARAQQYSGKISQGSTVQSVKVLENGNIATVMRNGEVVDTGKKAGQNLRVVSDGAGGTMLVGTFGASAGQNPIPVVPTEDAISNASDKAGSVEAAKSGGVNLTPGQQKVDEAFAKEYVDWSAAGGFSSVKKNLDQLRDVQSMLESGDANLTGFTVGNQPRATLALTNPEALDAMELVEEVVQRNLRLVLGAQFTEKEGVRLIARAYNPRLSEEKNAQRVARLIDQIGDAAKSKQEAAAYFEKNGTLAGWEGKLFTIGDFDPDANMGDGELTSDEKAELERLRRKYK